MTSTGSVLVLGAGGFLGGYLAQHFSAQGRRTFAVGHINHKKKHILSRLPSVSLHELDIPHPELEELLKRERPQLIIHAAGTASIDDSMAAPHRDFTKVVDLTAAVLESVRLHSPTSQVVLLSSASVYGNPAALPISEQSPTKPISAYAYHKLMCELLFEEYAKLFGLRTSIARIFSAYGDGIQRQVVFALCQKLSASGADAAILRGTGLETRDFIHASDVARAIDIIARADCRGPINVASGRQTSIAELAGLVQRFFGRPLPIQYDNIVPPGSPRFWQADISLLLSLGFSPEVSLENGIESFCSWFKREHDHESRVLTLPEAAPPPSKERLRIAVPTIGMRGWLGGVSYVEFLFRAMRTLPREEQAELVLVANDPERLELYHDTLSLADGLVLCGPKFNAPLPELPPGVRRVNSYRELLDEVDLYFPVCEHYDPHPALGYWLWDFQHRHLPQYFSSDEVQRRDQLFAFYARQHVVVTSSKCAEKELRALHPNCSAKTKVLSFHFAAPDSVFAGDPNEARARYGVPQRYLMCCNQFWMHKNHIRVFEALLILKKRGTPVHIVFTGHTGDGRDEQFYPGLMEMVKAWGISDCFQVLGVLPREDQLQLMRGALAVVQPSLFEGWSTVVEDARALGKHIILSDIEVHLEQQPHSARYFHRHDSMALAAMMESAWNSRTSAPDAAEEERARNEGKALVAAYARGLLEVAKLCRAARDAVLSPSVARPGNPSQHSSLFG